MLTEKTKMRDRETRGCSSVGRAPALQAGGHGFESHHLHQPGRPGGQARQTSAKIVREPTMGKEEERVRQRPKLYPEYGLIAQLVRARA